MCVLCEGFQSIGFRDLGVTIPIGSVTIGQMPLVGVDHSRSDSIMPLILRTVCCTMAKALALYYGLSGQYQPY
jgi:hypothetical protein